MLPIKFRIIWPNVSEEGRRLEIDQSEIRMPEAYMFVNGSELNELSLQQISIYLAKRFLNRRCFRNQPIRNKNCLWWLCLSIDQNEMSKSCRGPSIDASYQATVYLAKWFQRRRFDQKSTNQKQELSVVAMSVNESERNEQCKSNYHTIMAMTAP